MDGTVNQNQDIENPEPGDAPELPEPTPSASWKVSLVICLAILGVAAAVVTLTFMTEPEAEREGATKRTPMLVKVMEAEQGDFRPQIVATGTVRAEREVDLRPQVSGRILSIADNFKPGGFVEKGDVLVRLEAADFQNVVAQRESAVADAEAELALERGRQDVAKSEAKIYGQELSEEDQKLILRKPQLRSALGKVDAARASLNQARLDLRRTTIVAPFDAHVIDRMTNMGSVVSPNDTLGRLVGTDAYWVAMEVPMPMLRWIQLPEGESKGAPVVLRNKTGWAPGVTRAANVDSLVGSLDGDTRMARILAVVADPLARDAAQGEQPLMVGEFVEAKIAGRELQSVVRLPRDYVRANDTVWVMADGKLEVRDVEVTVRDREFAYISSGLEGGDKVVTTHLTTVKDGAPLRIEGDSNAEAASE